MMLAVRSVEDGKGTDDDIRWDGKTGGRRRGEAERTIGGDEKEGGGR